MRSRVGLTSSLVHQLADDLALVGGVLVLPGDVDFGRGIGQHAPVDVWHFLANLLDLLSGDEAFLKQVAVGFKGLFFLGCKAHLDSSIWSFRASC